MRSHAEIQDDLHELEIRRAGLMLELCYSEGCRQSAEMWSGLQQRMIQMRSAEQVRRMEDRGGLL